jgi:hypothetical protein
MAEVEKVLKTVSCLQVCGQLYSILTVPCRIPPPLPMRRRLERMTRCPTLVRMMEVRNRRELLRPRTLPPTRIPRPR